MVNDYVQINYDVIPPLELSSDYAICKRQRRGIWKRHPTSKDL